MKKIIVYLFTFLFLVVMLGNVAYAQPAEEEYDAWLQSSQLGPYQPEVEDFDEILEAAREEDPAVIYSSSSRIYSAVERFNEEYGLEVEALNLSTGDLIERVRREADAGVYEVDVVFVGNPAMVQEQLMTVNALTNYVPRDLQDKIDVHEYEPLLRHRYSLATWYYNTDDPDGAVPYENIWELTTEEWRNRVVSADPLESGTNFDFYTGLIANADKMEALYEEYFDEPFETDTPNAGYEFIRRLLDNDLRIVPSGRDVVEAVDGATGNMVGIQTQALYREVVEGDRDFYLDFTVNPSILSMRYVAMGTLSESPNQAKMLIDYLMSQEGGQEWWGSDFPVVRDIVQEGPLEDLYIEDWTHVWDADIEDALDIRDPLIDYWTLWR